MDLLTKHINDLTKEDWISLYIDQGLTLTELSRNFGVSPKTISVRLEKVGVERRSCGRVAGFVVEKEELEYLYDLTLRENLRL